jgi:hypothetical protein
MDAGFVGRGQARDRATVWGHPDSIAHMLSAQRLTISTSAVALNTASPSGQRLIIKNTSGNAADLGPSTVTALNGIDLAGGVTSTVELKPTEVLYAIRSGGVDATIAVLRT